MRCLKKDRQRQYDTANGLAQDIERHLKHEPVEACPPSAAYRMQKFARRNKVVVTAGAAVGAALDEWETPRLCRGDSQSLTTPGVN
jgi:hypothetical protein